jgi:hypothetical protein
MILADAGSLWTLLVTLRMRRLQGWRVGSMPVFGRMLPGGDS